MTEDMIDNSTSQDESSQLDAVEALDISQLRKVAKLLNVGAHRDWGKEDYIAAIQAKQTQKTAAAVVFDSNKGPRPGHARIVLHRDPTPGHANSPVQVGVNGRLLSIPRGVEVDIPEPFVTALNNARSTITRQQQGVSRDAPGGLYKDEEIVSYPFQVIAITPGGDFSNPNDSRSVEARRRQTFADKFGRYPTAGELNEYLSAQIKKQA